VAIFDQYLTISQKRSKLGTLLLWKANRKSRALYQITLTNLNHPFSTFCIHFHTFVVGGERDFKFSRQVDRSKC